MSKSPGNTNGFTSALRRAFTWHWHLLGLGTAVSFAIISGVPHLWLPFIAAGEIAYFGLLGLNPRFQNVLRGGKLVPPPLPKNDDSAARFQQLMAFLSPTDETRFRHLHSRCAALLDLRRSMDAKDNHTSVVNFRGESLDRMLWLFLKLLHQRSGLERFLQTTQRADIERELELAEEQLTAARARDTVAGLPDGRLTTSIAERINTIRERLHNHQKASEDLELVTAEIDKTEQQITHICEVGMTTRDSASLSAQIDGISESLQASEKTFAHASVASLFEEDEVAPPLLSASTAPLTTRQALRQH